MMNELSIIDGSCSDFPMLSVLGSDGTVHPESTEPEISRDTALKIYRTMVFTRCLDERMIAAQRQGRLSFYMSCTGEEAAVAASAAALSDEDMIFGQYREQASLIYRGFPLRQLLRQLLGKAGDLGKGRQMPVHYGSRDHNFMTIRSTLATQIPQATGYAYGQKISQTGVCSICYFGDGAASEGDFHAGLNMASVLKAPVIFFCRNNGYAISTPTKEQYAGNGIASRAPGYGMKALRVDGNDFLAVYDAVREGRKIVLEQGEPVLIEALTYRLAAHSTSDDASVYRRREEEETWKNRDPLTRIKSWLLKRGWLTDSEDEHLIDGYRTEILAELKAVETESPPSLEDLFTDVYDVMPPHLEAQYTDLKNHVAKYPDAYHQPENR